MIFVSSCPARPTNGSPWMSSSAPGRFADEHQVRLRDCRRRRRSAGGRARAACSACSRRYVRGGRRAPRPDRRSSCREARLTCRLPAAPAWRLCVMCRRRPGRQIRSLAPRRVSRDAVNAELAVELQMFGEGAAIDHRDAGAAASACGASRICSTRSRIDRGDVGLGHQRQRHGVGRPRRASPDWSRHRSPRRAPRRRWRRSRSTRFDSKFASRRRHDGRRSAPRSR